MVAAISCGVLVPSRPRSLVARSRRLCSNNAAHHTEAQDATGLPLEELPNVVIEEVLARLEVPDRLRAASTCKLLYELSSDDRKWACMFERDFPRLKDLLDSNSPEWHSGRSWKSKYLQLCRGAEFQAQVYNREAANDDEDFVLSAYDATLTLELDSLQALWRHRAARPEAASAPPNSSAVADTKCADAAKALEQAVGPSFVARYMPMGGTGAVVEQGISMDRVRAPPPGVSHSEVYKCDLAGLQPGDEVEVQWKGRKFHPFGWWYGIVAGVAPADNHVTLLFRQYPDSSVWRWVAAPLVPGKETVVNGDANFGYVGGVRPLSEREKKDWRHLQAAWQADDADSPDLPDAFGYHAQLPSADSAL